MLRYCDTCNMKKPVNDFKRYGKECAECRLLRVESSKERFYTNRVRCKCGLYTSEGNPIEKHVKSHAHLNYLKYGTRNPQGIDFLERTCQWDKRANVLTGIELNERIENIRNKK